MPSARFVTLEIRVRELRRLLLPSRFDPTGTYNSPDRVTTRALAFRVLVHAEFEAYLEDRAVEVAKTAQKSWETAQHVSKVSLHLVGFSGMSMEGPPETLTTTDPNKQKSWPDKVKIDERFTRACSNFIRDVMRLNHGVKEANIMSMLMPLGFDMNKCDALFLQTMNNFGEARGAVAHSSGATMVAKAVDPSDEFKLATGIVQSFKAIDEEFDALLTAASP